MPSIQCACGATTNTAVCDWIDGTKTGKATACYAKWVDGHWEEGCHYAVADELMKAMADGLMAGANPGEAD